ncbi:MAG TPA: hypothetical protein VK178_01160 [Opitutaceae bacterium]|nr:hypothetical protein [Opitutaceae bacterium]
MPQNNLVSAKPDPAAAAAVKAALATARQKLPYLVNLTPAQRRDLPKMGPSTYPFVVRILEMAKANSQLVPPSFDLAAFEQDHALWQELAPIAVQLTQLNELFNDTVLALGSDLYGQARTAYGFLKVGGDHAGLDTLRATAAQRFARRKPAPAPNPADA